MDEILSDDRKDFLTLTKEALGQMKLEIRFKKLSKEAVIPTYAHVGDVGMDLTATSVEYDRDNDMYIYHTGLAFESDQHYGIFLFPRSSNRKTDAYMCNHVGIIDSAISRGEIMVCYKNRTSLDVRAEMEKSRSFFNSILYNSFTITNGNVVEFTWPNAVQNAMGSADWIYSNPLYFAPYKVGDRVAQMVVLPYPDVVLSERAELSETDRGSGGFGSTGN